MKYKPMEDLCRSFGAGAVEVVSKFICAALQCRLEGPRSSDQGPCTTEACMTHGMKRKPMENLWHGFVTGAVEV
jgi:hypothetical protein